MAAVDEVRDGLEGVLAFASEIAEPDRDGGALRYRGIDVEELVGTVPFEGVWGLLVDGRPDRPLAPAGTHPLGYRTGEAWNESAYSDPNFDAKLKDALSISDPEKRREVMKDLETILQDSGVIIQPFWQKLYSHTAANVRNYGVHQTFQMDLQKVWLEQA